MANPPEAYIDAVRSNAPATTREVADAVGVTRQAADYRLRNLREDDVVDGKMIGNTLVWTVTETSSSETDTEGNRAPTPTPTQPETSAPTPRVEEIVDRVAEGWDDKPARIEDRKTAAMAVLEYAREHGSVSKSEAKEEVFPEAGVEGQNPRTWYRKNIRPVLNEAAEYDPSKRGYTLTAESEGGS